MHHGDVACVHVNCPCLLLCVGSAVLVTTTTDMDKTGASYYGEQGLHYLSTRGDGNMVQLGRLVIILTMSSPVLLFQPVCLMPL